MDSSPQFTCRTLLGKFTLMQAIIFGENVMVGVNFPGDNFPGAIFWEAIFLMDNYPRGQLSGGKLSGDNFLRGQMP